VPVSVVIIEREVVNGSHEQVVPPFAEALHPCNSCGSLIVIVLDAGMTVDTGPFTVTASRTAPAGAAQQHRRSAAARREIRHICFIDENSVYRVVEVCPDIPMQCLITEIRISSARENIEKQSF